jgi:hypothetical protein
LANITSREIKAPLHGEFRLRLDLLRKQFPEDYLLREVLGADYGVVGAGRNAAGEQNAKRENGESAG